MPKRVVFQKGNQKKFIEETRGKLGISWKDFADKLKVNLGSLEKSYRYEYCSLSYNLFRKICLMANKREATVLKKYGGIVEDYEPNIPRKVFGESRLKLPTPVIKSRGDYKLDISKIRFSKTDQIKNIKLPNKISPLLAEEIGMHVGDGFLSANRYEFRLKGNKNNEKEYYDNYIKRLFKNLYNSDVKLKEYETTYGFELNSKAIWEFKTKIIGIKAGIKDEICVPTKIKEGNQEILTAFIRGLFDTDGSISFKSKYGYQNYYPVISIAQKSKKLITDVDIILINLGFKTVTSTFKDYWKIDLNGYKNLEKYSKLIGWSSPKNINKISKWRKSYPKLSMADVV